jgi:lipoprotein Spr
MSIYIKFHLTPNKPSPKEYHLLSSPLNFIPRTEMHYSMISKKSIILIVLFLLPLTTHASSKGFISEKEKQAYTNWLSEKNEEHSKPQISLNKRIMKQYERWRGTPYLYGGADHRGIDCSAFTQKVISSLFHRNIPRTAKEQSKKGWFVYQNKLQPGDLVFFETKPNVRHVGVYVGGGSFMHASSSHGVMVSSLYNRYWNAHFLTARRYLSV